MRSHILCLDRGYTVHLFRRLPSAYLTAREQKREKKKQTTDRRMKEVDGNGNHSHFFVRVIFFLDINSKESSKFTHKVHKLKSIQFLILTAIVKSTRNQKERKDDGVISTFIFVIPNGGGQFSSCHAIPPQSPTRKFPCRAGGSLYGNNTNDSSRQIFWGKSRNKTKKRRKIWRESAQWKYQNDRFGVVNRLIESRLIRNTLE